MNTIDLVGLYFERNRIYAVRAEVPRDAILHGSRNLLAQPDSDLSAHKLLLSHISERHEIPLDPDKQSHGLRGAWDWVVKGGYPSAICLASFGPLLSRRMSRATPELPKRVEKYPLSSKPLDIETFFEVPLEKSRERTQLVVTKDTFACATAEFYLRRLANEEDRKIHAGELLCFVNVGYGIGIGYRADGFSWRPRVFPEMGHMRVVRSPTETMKSTCGVHATCLSGHASAMALNQRLGREKFGPLPDELHDDVRIIEAEYLSQMCDAINQMIAPDVIVLGGPVGEIPNVAYATNQELIRTIRKREATDPHPRLPRLQYVQRQILDTATTTGAVGALIMAGERLAGGA